MKELTIKREDKTYTIYNSDMVYSKIVFDTKGFGAVLSIDGVEYRVEQEGPKSANKIMIRDGNTLFRFKFDKIWGGATLQSGNEDMGYKITGKWFKPGTRLVDKHNTDLVTVVSTQSLPPKITARIYDESITAVLVTATVYYHLYVSVSKTMGMAIVSGM